MGFFSDYVTYMASSLFFHFPSLLTSIRSKRFIKEIDRGGGKKGKYGGYKKQLLEHKHWGRDLGVISSHWMKSFLWPSGIQESSAPSLVSIWNHEIDHIQSLRKRPFLLQLMGEPQGNWVMLITPEVSCSLLRWEKEAQFFQHPAQGLHCELCLVQD